MRLPTLSMAIALAVCWGAAHAAVITSVDPPRPGGARHYLMAAPARIAPGKHPLVLLFHGHMGSAAGVLGKKSVKP